jgi:Predicted DNA-binding proteins
MPRPMKYRIINGRPITNIFKPAGIPQRELEEVILTLDELEALRLADLEGKYQEDAAKLMGVSRQTFRQHYRISAQKGGRCACQRQGASH